MEREMRTKAMSLLNFPTIRYDGETLCRQMGSVKRRCDSCCNWLVRRWWQARTVGAELVGLALLGGFRDADYEGAVAEGADASLAHQR